MIHNPVLKGFNPDPSYLRVGDDFYIATSTFEWFPGVQIHHSRDLENWKLLTHPLTRTSQLDLRGVPSSGGVWAPNLTYHDGTFYLIYTNMKNRTGPYKDCHNYLVTAENIMGPWSEPIYLNSSGFDPALFHDDGGRKWLINMNWNFQKSFPNFDGILLQEYCAKQKKLIGPVRKIIDGMDHWVIEGSNMYKRNGYYYIVLAEGGTGYNHSATLVRSKNIEGPYEGDPTGPILTSRNDPDHPLQKAGHGSIVESQNGKWYIAYLCARPLPSMLCPLGRETAIQECYWTEDGWLKLVGNTHLPALTANGPGLPPHQFEPEPEKDDFEDNHLNIHFNTLRIPGDESWLSLNARPGFLRVVGQESLTSLHHQSVVARRIQDYDCDIETCVEFEPENYMQMAGLLCMYDEKDHYYLRISYDEKLGKNLNVIYNDCGAYGETLDEGISIHDFERVYLKLSIRKETFTFYYSNDGGNWVKIGPDFNFDRLSDEYNHKLGFTGAFAGMGVQDISGQRKYADFDFFSYHLKEG